MLLSFKALSPLCLHFFLFKLNKFKINNSLGNLSQIPKNVA